MPSEILFLNGEDEKCPKIMQEKIQTAQTQKTTAATAKPAIKPE